MVVTSSINISIKSIGLFNILSSTISKQRPVRNYVPILFFDPPPPMKYNGPWSKREIWPNLKGSHIKIPHPPKLVCMHFTSTSTCMNFMSRFYFMTPMDYNPWSEGKFWSFLKADRKEPNLRNQSSHTHQN